MGVKVSFIAHTPRPSHVQMGLATVVVCFLGFFWGGGGGGGGGGECQWFEVCLISFDLGNGMLWYCCSPCRHADVLAKSLKIKAN